MRILVACEESQAVTIEFRKLGHEAFSCDIVPCTGGHPEWHLQQDVTELLKQHWDMIIAFPPCTFLSNAGAAQLYPQKGKLDQVRYQKGLEAKEFFMQFYTHSCPKIVIENPGPSAVFNLPKPTQIIQPYEHGHPFSKRTLLWIKGVAPLEPTNVIHKGIKKYIDGGSKDARGNPIKRRGVTGDNKTLRSKTFPGIAKAMATQWGTKFNRRIQRILL